MRANVWTTSLLIAAATVVVAPSDGHAAQPAPSSTARGGGAKQVTLLTGDVVTVSDQPVAGDLPVRIAGDRHVPLHQYAVRHGKVTDWYVVPGDAAPLIAAGQVDRELFNVTRLVRQGYDDAAAPDLPLLLDRSPEANPRDGARIERSVPELGYTAVRQPKDRAEVFWAATIAARAQKRSGAAPKIWLNAKVQALLDQSVPQIGAPQAWARGFTGQGQTVAVLDTGYDPAHPDLRGKVVAERDFTGGGSAKDGNGHGTHVASTIAGSGAASGGKYKGVAPDATLAVGKVLGDDGSGRLDQLIAGMEWAVGAAGAKVVSMSLGTQGTDGTDPVSQALNRLSAAHDALFVVAAGNDGEDESVGVPAVADAALAVASVSKQDTLSPFSSRGPRRRDGALKPEIAAPGGAIVAARAAGTSLGTPVNDDYTQLDGTSMATPHVAGAAAILRQSLPAIGHELLKAKLVASAEPVDNAGPFAVGSGRVDLARAVTQQIYPETAAFSTFLRWPGTGQISRPVTYRNDGDTPVELRLKLDLSDAEGAPTAPELAKLSATTVTVPAHSTAGVNFVETPRGGGEFGIQRGVLTATSTDGSVALRTPVSVNSEGPSHDLTVALVDRNGRPGAEGDFDVVNLDTNELTFAGGSTTLRLPAGRYAIKAFMFTPRPGQQYSTTIAAVPELRIAADQVITLDARLGDEMSITTDQPDARAGVWVAGLVSRSTPDNLPSIIKFLFEPRFDKVFAFTAGPDSPAFALLNSTQLERPETEFWLEEPTRWELNAQWVSPQPPSSRRLRTAAGGGGLPEDLASQDVRNKLVVLELPFDISREEAYRRVDNVRAAGGAMVAMTAQEPGNATSLAVMTASQTPSLPSMVVAGSNTARLVAAARTGTLDLTAIDRPASPFVYQLSFPVDRGLHGDLHRFVRTKDLAAVDARYHGTSGENLYVSAWTYALGLRLGTYSGAPAQPGTQRPEYYTPGRWDISVGDVDYDNNRRLSTTVTLAAGERRRLEWNSAVHGPAFTGTAADGKPWAFREGDTLDLLLPLFGDAAGHRRTAPRSGRGETVLTRDNRELGRTATPGTGRFPVPADGGRYRVTTHLELADHQVPEQVRAEWTFKSEPAPGTRTLPLLAVSVRPEVGLDNTLRATQSAWVPIELTRQDGSPRATEVRLRWSTDDGHTWQAAAMLNLNGRYLAWLPPSHAGYLSVQASAADTDGNTVEVTTIRAVKLI